MTHSYTVYLSSFYVEKCDKGFKRWTWVAIENGDAIERLTGGYIHGDTLTRWGSLRQAKRWVRRDRNTTITYHNSKGNLL